MSVIRKELAHAAMSRYLTKGGFSEIYEAVWVDGKYEEWDSKKQQLKRFGSQKVILKKLENVESANQSWFEEAKSHLTIKEELEVFHSKPYDFSIPTNIDDFNNSSNQNNSRTSKINSFFKANSKKLSKMFKKLQVKDETVQQTKGSNVNFDDDEDEVYNNPNFHSEEQDEFEIPKDI
ncbi:kinase-like domain-containing protein [Rhizophagus irregularis DAOM 181602=DAOM 197198]|nr:kinase-like domain-containing protein [Rhizophagus irregularis DAOM 181602=DAOM 197198]